MLAADPPIRHRARPTTGRAFVALAAIVMVITVGLAALLAPPATASTFTGPGNVVGVQTHAAGQRVGVHEEKLPGQGRERAPAYDQIVVGHCVAPEAEPTVVNLGGEGEVPGAINQQPPNALEPGWGASRTDVAGKSLAELRAIGDPYVVGENTALPFASNSVDQVITNSVPVDVNTPMGPGIQSSEVWRILRLGGEWLHNGETVPGR